MSEARPNQIARLSKSKLTTADQCLKKLHLSVHQNDLARQHFPDAETAMNVDDVGTMALAVSHGMGLARMPCYIGDTDPSLRRLDLPLTPSTWGIWILSHIGLRSTARVRVAREFLIESIEGQREVVLGEDSNY